MIAAPIGMYFGTVSTVFKGRTFHPTSESFDADSSPQAILRGLELQQL